MPPGVELGGLALHDAAAISKSRRADEAAEEVDRAQQAVERARREAAEARAALDEFVARHFDQPVAPSDKPPAATSKRDAVPPVAPAKAPSNAEWERLTRKFDELSAQRSELLERYTTAHPQVVELDGRLVALAEELSSFADRPEVELLPPSLPDALLPSITESRTAEHEGENAVPEIERRQAVSSEYHLLLAGWQDAEHNLQAAIAAEIVARERLAALTAPPAPASPPVLIPAPLPEKQKREAGEESRSGGSQPLALAALLIALAVAALAAVRLAHSESIFGSIEEVAAGLALPIVGVIPAIESNRPARWGVVRFAILLGELALAFAAFAALAYGVQNAPAIWHYLRSTLESGR